MFARTFLPADHTLGALLALFLPVRHCCLLAGPKRARLDSLRPETCASCSTSASVSSSSRLPVSTARLSHPEAHSLARLLDLQLTRSPFASSFSSAAAASSSSPLQCSPLGASQCLGGSSLCAPQTLAVICTDFPMTIGRPSLQSAAGPPRRDRSKSRARTTIISVTVALTQCRRLTSAERLLLNQLRARSSASAPHRRRPQFRGSRIAE